MSKFRLAIDNLIEFPVNADIKSGRQTRNFFFHLTAPRMTADEWRAMVGPDAANPNQPIEEFLRERVNGWRGQQLVLDEAGSPAAFDAEAFDAMLSVNGIAQLIFVAYMKAIFASDGDSGRRKNSVS